MLKMTPEERTIVACPFADTAISPKIRRRYITEAKAKHRFNNSTFGHIGCGNTICVPSYYELTTYITVHVMDIPPRSNTLVEELPSELPEELVIIILNQLAQVDPITVDMISKKITLQISYPEWACHSPSYWDRVRGVEYDNLIYAARTFGPKLQVALKRMKKLRNKSRRYYTQSNNAFIEDLESLHLKTFQLPVELALREVCRIVERARFHIYVVHHDYKISYFWTKHLFRQVFTEEYQNKTLELNIVGN